MKKIVTSHKIQERLLDLVEWSEFPEGFAKQCQHMAGRSLVDKVPMCDIQNCNMGGKDV